MAIVPAALSGTPPQARSRPRATDLDGPDVAVTPRTGRPARSATAAVTRPVTASVGRGPTWSITRPPARVPTETVTPTRIDCPASAARRAGPWVRASGTCIMARMPTAVTAPAAA